MKKLILSLSLALFAISCSSNDDDETTVPVEETPVLPTKISFSNIIDPSGTIKYNGNKISDITWADNAKYVYEYTGSLITKITEYDGAGAKDLTTDFTYSNDKLVKSVAAESNGTRTTTYSYPDANTISFTSTRNYTFAGTAQVDKDVTILTLNTGNVFAEETTYYHNNALAGKISSTYTYDDKASVYTNVSGYDKLLAYNYTVMDENTAGKNNVLIKNQTNTTVSGSISKYKNVNTMTYSAAGYPKQIATKQYNANNQVNDSYVISYDYSK